MKLEYVEVRGQGFKKENEWFEHCKHKAIPHLVIRRKRKYAVVHMDFITTAIQHEYFNSEKWGRRFMDMAIPLVKLKTAFSGGFYSHATVLIEDAPKLARAWWWLATQIMEESKAWEIAEKYNSHTYLWRN